MYLTAPIPRACEATVNTRAAITSRAVKPMSEKVSHDKLLRVLEAATPLNKQRYPGVLSEGVEPLDRRDQGPEDPRHLRVLVDEKRVRLGRPCRRGERH